MMSSLHIQSSNLLTNSGPWKAASDARCSKEARLRSGSFFGSNDVLSLSRSSRNCSRSRPATLPPSPVARIKRRSEPQLDRVIQRDKKVRVVQRVKELLCRQEGRTMSLQQLGRYRKQIGLRGQRRCVVLLNKYPAVFEVFNQGGGQCWFRLTRQAEQQYLDEQTLKGDLESILVDKVRKLLMMSVQKQVLIEHISHIRRDLGLPEDFRTSMLPHHPQFFRIKAMLEGPTLALTSWDPRLAVSAAEYQEAKEIAELDAMRKARALGTSAHPPPYESASTSTAASGMPEPSAESASAESSPAESASSESESADHRVSPGGAQQDAAWRDGSESGRDILDVGEGGPEWEEEEEEEEVQVRVRGEEFGASWGSRPMGGMGPSSPLEEGGEAASSGRGEGGGEGVGGLGEEAALAALMRGRELVGAGAYGGPNDPMRYRKERRMSVKLPAGFNVSRRDLMKMQEFLDLPLVSPYADAVNVKAGSPEAEKRNCGVVHEILSLTTEKRMLLDHFTHFRKEYKFPARLRGMVIRHPELFYLSEKGLRDSIFLREAYVGSELVAKDPFKETYDDLRRLVAQGKRFQRIDRDLDEGDGEEDDSADEEEEDGEEEEEDGEDGEWDGFVSASENGGQKSVVRKEEQRGVGRGQPDGDRPWFIKSPPRERVTTGVKEKW